ncbi:tetratricopeptide repeat protein [Facklamia miroungae]|uniref:Uncharacterized protein n=1 Tax=Facklamia miroungae TaxID=120956 RepID=A0A1G7PKM7_9LACT|nr:hypothetical protein [Facklamia miroungae]NKZ28751.1 hypothetical protein [Facklamia miroungae]SDF86865.1 hypothetical protein SAMN05421791_101293 [Facklamia miroungae]
MDNFFDLIESSPAIEDQYKILKRALKKLEFSNKEQYEQLLNRIESWGQSGYRHLQIQSYLDLYEKYPSSALAFYLGQAYLMVGQFDKANQWIEKVDSNQLPLEARLVVADVHLNVGHLNQTKKELEAIIKDFPRDYRAYVKMSHFYRLQGINEKAIQYLETLMEYFISEPASLRRQWRTQLLELYLTSERIDAVKIKDLFNQDPDNLAIETADECYLLAHFYAQINDFQHSNDYCEQGLALEADHFELRLLQLDNLTWLNDREGFALRLDQLLKRLPPFDATIMDCLVLANRIKVYTAKLIDLLEAFYPLLENTEDQFLVLSAYVSFYLDRKDYHQANLFMEKFDLASIDEALLAYLKGKILFDQGEKAAAKDYLELAWNQQVAAEDLEDLIQQLTTSK